LGVDPRDGGLVTRDSQTTTAVCSACGLIGSIPWWLAQLREPLDVPEASFLPPPGRPEPWDPDADDDDVHDEAVSRESALA
jgi:hypothetical protein